MKTEERGISRRAFLTTAGGVALGMGIARLPGTAQAAEAQALPWPYPEDGLDGDQVAKTAYCLLYLQGGCGQGSAQSIIDAITATVPDPWETLPRGLYKYAGGGVVGWGTICGALNGAVAVMDILGVHGALGNALIDYFCNTELPTNLLVDWDPADDGWTGVPAPISYLSSTVATVSHSPLCHVTSGIWAAAADVPVSDPAAKNRCARLVADIVFKTVELLNDHFLRGITPGTWEPPSTYATCYGCHTQPDMVPSQQGKMDCLACHDVRRAHSYWKPGKGGRRR